MGLNVVGIPTQRREGSIMANQAVVHVIDDDAIARKSLANLLTTEKFHVRTYKSAGAFLKVLPEVEDGCILTDFRMPKVDGLELIRRVRNLGRKMPAIVISGRYDVSLATEVVRAGAIGFLKKPVDAELLIAWTRSAFVRGMQRRARTNGPGVASALSH